MVSPRISIAGAPEDSLIEAQGAELSLRSSIAAIGRRVDAPARGEVERDQVAQHHQLQHPRGAGLALGLDGDDASASGATSSPVSSMRRRSRGCWSESSSRTQAKAAVAREPSQPAISLWSASGSGEKKAGTFAFSLTWVFQR